MMTNSCIGVVGAECGIGPRPRRGALQMVVNPIVAWVGCLTCCFLPLPAGPTRFSSPTPAQSSHAPPVAPCWLPHPEARERNTRRRAQSNAYCVCVDLNFWWVKDTPWGCVWSPAYQRGGNGSCLLLRWWWRNEGHHSAKPAAQSPHPHVA